MASLTRTTTAVLGVASVLAITTSTVAQTATQADIDACNKAAQASSAVSRGSAAGAPEPTTPGSLDSHRQRNSSGRLSPSAGSPGTNAGTTGPADTPSASPRTSATDARLTGMAATGHASAPYQQAYRDCMKERGF